MTQSEQSPEQLIADESGAVYAVPTEVLEAHRLTSDQLAERAASQRASDDEVQGYHHSGYMVRPGDNFWAIAQRMYGDGRYWVYLYGANADQIRNPNLIQPGQVLRLL